MNSELFMKEIKTTKYHQNYEEVYKAFQVYQKLSLDTLLEFHNVCEKNNIKYQLAFGSLLGIIRDDGQIPWDYDIDVIVLQSERKKLIECLRKDLSDNFYFFCAENNPTCNHVIIRLAPRGYDTEVLHVDVFFLTGLPNNTKLEKRHKRNIKKATLVYKANKFKFFKKGTASKTELIKMLLYKIAGLGKTEEELWKQYLTIVEKYQFEDSIKCCTADRFSGMYDWDADLFKNTTLKSTKDGVFRIPVKFEEILTIGYGDYNRIAPLSIRLDEMMYHYRLLKSYERF